MDATIAVLSRVPERTPESSERVVRTPALQLWLVLAILDVAAFAHWGEQRECAAALKDFAGEQTAGQRGTRARVELRISMESQNG